MRIGHDPTETGPQLSRDSNRLSLSLCLSLSLSLLAFSRSTRPSLSLSLSRTTLLRSISRPFGSFFIPVVRPFGRRGALCLFSQKVRNGDWWCRLVDVLAPLHLPNDYAEWRDQLPLVAARAASGTPRTHTRDRNVLSGRREPRVDVDVSWSGRGGIDSRLLCLKLVSRVSLEFPVSDFFAKRWISRLKEPHTVRVGF